jgi:hypothetical protein
MNPPPRTMRPPGLIATLMRNPRLRTAALLTTAMLASGAGFVGNTTTVAAQPLCVENPKTGAQICKDTGVDPILLPDGTMVGNPGSIDAQQQIQDKKRLARSYIDGLNGSVAWGTYTADQAAYDNLYHVVTPPSLVQTMCPTNPSSATSRRANITINTCGGGEPGGNSGTPETIDVYMSHEAESPDYYCGPASAVMILRSLGYSTSHDGEPLNQGQLAGNGRKYLETDYWHAKDPNQGTPWAGEGAADQPMSDSLNYWRVGKYKDFYIVSSHPDLNSFVADMKYDLYRGYPFSVNTDEPHDAFHFPGHPNIQKTIWHWMAVNGWHHYGDITHYGDPATSVWSGTPDYGDVATSNMDQAVQAHGIAW